MPETSASPAAANVPRNPPKNSWLAAQGIETLRIAAAKVLADPQAVADEILAYALARKARMGRGET